jgi:hypothetical protein
MRALVSRHHRQHHAASCAQGAHRALEGRVTNDVTLILAFVTARRALRIACNNNKLAQIWLEKHHLFLLRVEAASFFFS